MLVPILKDRRTQHGQASTGNSVAAQARTTSSGMFSGSVMIRGPTPFTLPLVARILDSCNAHLSTSFLGSQSTGVRNTIHGILGTKSEELPNCWDC